MKIREQVHWGIAGCGWVARDYVAPAIGEARSTRLCAVYDTHPEALESFAPDQIGVSRYAGLAEFLSAPDLDAVYVATPNHSHAELVVAAAAAGKHVLCEKPMATRLSDAEQMVRSCERARVLYATAFDQRFHAAHIALREVIQAGELGDVTAARIHYACWLPPDWSEDNWRVDPVRAGGGAFMDLAPHGIDLLSYLLDDDFTEAQCLLQRKVFPYAVDDGAMWIARTLRGALATIHAAYNCPDNFPRRTLEIYGTEAMAIARNTMGQTAGGSVELVARDGRVRRLAVRPNLDRSPFLSQIECFSRCILDGVPFPFSPYRDLKTMQLLQEAAAPEEVCH